ncbi:hypothetical protein HMPREF0542_11531 [Ligilactobacillus ruminis ATCC 25644]|uniref:Uncharacterized protein n=1 Tax=Ligilactobacillus ruminis ATCC 25644 TaxID=525362 RepID=E7FRK4_9LACO|nr:hypothetical protein HMPREF0542_11531 [Ligilactobacillus ruminis ATCC 25644]
MNLFNFMRLFLTLFDPLKQRPRNICRLHRCWLLQLKRSSKPVRPVRNFAGIIFEHFDDHIFLVKRSQLIS